MRDLVDLIVSNGIGVACIVYFMFRDYHFMDSLNKTMTSLHETLEVIERFLIEERK